MACSIIMVPIGFMEGLKENQTYRSFAKRQVANEEGPSSILDNKVHSVILFHGGPSWSQEARPRKIVIALSYSELEGFIFLIFYVTFWRCEDRRYIESEFLPNA